MRKSTVLGFCIITNHEYCAPNKICCLLLLVISRVRYEDIVNDMPGVAKAIIQATGLKWEPDVLNFHKKRQAVNTLSTNQVRKGIYKDGIESWKKYETQLKPLVKLVGSNVRYPLKTSIPGYNPPL